MLSITDQTGYFVLEVVMISVCITTAIRTTVAIAILVAHMRLHKALLIVQILPKITLLVLITIRSKKLKHSLLGLSDLK